MTTALITGAVTLGAVGALGLVLWLYGRAQRRLGAQARRRDQAQEAADAKRRMEEVRPGSERGTAERLRDGDY